MAAVAIVGGGPAGLIAAETLATAGMHVVVFDRMATVGRKFLLAGRGGLNLTHAEDLEVLLTRYRPAAPQLVEAVRSYPPAQLRAWADSLGETTFVGTSGRVFPKSFRATPLLRAWAARLEELRVELRTRHAWTGWPLVVRPRDSDPYLFEADATLLACGGASWPRTGSDGRWTALVAAEPLRPSNMGLIVHWSDSFRSRFEGAPLKDVALSFGGHVSRGDAVITPSGLEGGAVYALSGPVREALADHGVAQLTVDNRPDQDHGVVSERLARRRPKSTVSAWLRAAGMSPVTVSLLREATANRLPVDPAAMAELVKATPVRVVGCQPIARAISSAGGVRFADVDEHLMLREHPGVFVAGEMLDWEAPTGGYLLQGTFSTGVAAANGVLHWLRGQRGAKG